MKLIILESHDPYKNLAIEEYLLECADDDIMMLWQNPPCVVIGKNQNAFAEINTDFTNKNGILVARRVSGGGAVYHDLGNVNYTFISSKREDGIDFKTFTAPIIDALSSLGVSVSLSGRNDLEANGRKVSGNAQHVRGSKVLHHGTLLFNSNLNILSDALKVDEEKIKTKAIKSTRSRVINLIDLMDEKIEVSDFISSIAEFVIKKYDAKITDAPKSSRIDELEKRNRSREWLFPENGYISKYSTRRKVKYNFGIVDIYLEMKNDVIEDAKILGDFFGVNDISIVEKSLAGKRIDELFEVSEILSISKYISGMLPEQFISQIKQ